jgi:hypothetical protein
MLLCTIILLSWIKARQIINMDGYINITTFSHIYLSSKYIQMTLLQLQLFIVQNPQLSEKFNFMAFRIYTALTKIEKITLQKNNFKHATSNNMLPSVDKTSVKVFHAE